jgi:hypothetical protein
MESLRYAHGNIFETFPFPRFMFEHGDSDLEQHGKRLFESRQLFMEEHHLGLTKFYNEFHNPDNNTDVLRDLRKLQGEINKFVVQRYGWRNVDPSTGFHQVGYLPNGKNVRFTVSEEARVKILRLLSKLNKARFEEQSKSSGSTSSTTSGNGSVDDDKLDDDLFDTNGGKG